VETLGKDCVTSGAENRDDDANEVVEGQKRLGGMNEEMELELALGEAATGGDMMLPLDGNSKVGLQQICPA
jgi:hypothetical protein